MALMGMLDEQVDLVVSGINPYANLGHDLTYSGTVTAAMEALIHGVPAVAVFDGRPGPSFHRARRLQHRRPQPPAQSSPRCWTTACPPKPC